MAYSAPSTISTGDLITAAKWNADVVANPIAIYAGGLSVTSQAIGDILYASSTTQFARVAAVAAGQVLTSAGTGTVPAYSATPALTSADMGGTTVYGSRAITVDTGGALNVVLAAAAGDDFTVDTDKLVVSGDTGDIGIGVAAPQAKLHILSASAGTHTPHASADELVIEGSSSTGLTIVTPDAQNGAVFWSSPSRTGNIGARVQYNYTSDIMTIGQITGGAAIALQGANTGVGTLAPVSLLDVRGPTGTGAAPAGLLTLSTAELTVADNDQLGRVDFRAPLATAGTDAILTAASIWAEANATFSASVNAADIVFATATSGAVAERMRITSTGDVSITGSLAVTGTTSGGGVGPIQHRISLTSGVSVTTADVTGASTLYLVPYAGNSAPLYDGSIWKSYTVSQLSISTSGGTASKPHDVFLDENGGTPVLALLAWTDDTNRATALALQDGVLCKTGDLSQRYVGTVYLDASKDCEDSLANRMCWNYYNRRVRAMSGPLVTTNSWTYSTNAWRQAEGVTTNQLNMVAGVSEDAFDAYCGVQVWNTGIGTGVQIFLGVGLDSTTAMAAGCFPGAVRFSDSESDSTWIYARWTGLIGIGKHKLVWLEHGNGNGTVQWSGDNANPGYIQSGVHGHMLG